jgi:hypothetical protein
MTLGDVGRDTVSALKGNPLMLVVVLLNVLMLILIGFSLRQTQENNSEIVKLAIEKCGK